MIDTTKILLKQVPLFSVLPSEVLDSLEKIIHEKTLTAGEVLFAEGDKGENFYIIKSGKIDILKSDNIPDKKVKLATRSKGDFFGEMSLLEDSPRFATAKATNDSTVLVFSRNNFQQLLNENPSIAMKVLGVLSSRLRDSDTQMIKDLEQKNTELEKTNKKLRDATEELEQSYENLKSTNNFLETIISASRFFIIVTDKQGKIFIFNEAAKQIFNLNFLEVAGQGIEKIFKPVGKTEILDDIETVLQNKETWSGDLLTNTINDEVMFIELVGARIFDEKGSLFTTLYMGRDVTDEKNVERQMILLDRMATRGEMAGEIAHELNNYMAIVLGNLELLQMEIELGKIDKAGKKIDSMLNGMDKMTRFTDGLMMYSRPEIKKELFDLHDFLENELFFIKSQNRFDGVEFNLDFNHDIPFITADKSQLQQALLNLLNNAADALKEHQAENPRITIQTEYQSETKSFILSIVDNGAGFTNESLDRVFRQHFTTKARGHGFGLLAVKRVIKNHDGKVWAEINPAGGAIFKVQMPVGIIRTEKEQPLKVN